MMSKLIKLLFIGRFDHQKGIDILLKVFRENSFPNIELILVGGSILQDRQFEIPAGVKHIGWLDAKKVKKYYKLCDAVIMPSRWEGFSLVALEAMKNKKALIASTATSLPEAVIDKVTGILFEIDKPEELCSILLSLDKRTLSQMGEKGYQRYKENFTAEIMNFHTLEIYKQLLKN
jgi:glycosyltransferase involved in cell wall biosynthesis